MKSIFTIVVLFLLSLQVSSQKLITTINTTNRVEPYTFKYHQLSGTWIYSDYDTTKKKSVLITTKGKSKEYDFDMSYSAVFDDAGNAYSYVYNTKTDTTYIYYFLKNGEETASFDFIGDGWGINNGILYFLAKENNMAFIAAYDTKTGSITKGKMYEDIFLVNYPQQYYEGEPQGTIGFTKNGEQYYLAVENGKKFLVIGTKEQKHYSDIDWYIMQPDNKGEFTYLAKSSGSFYAEKGNAFVVQGSKEYKAFDYVYGPVIFDKDNNPVYTSSDSIGEYKYRTRLMTGNSEGKSYDGSIYEYKLTPSGNTSYVVSASKTDPKKGDEIFENFLVVDGKKLKSYPSVSNVKFAGSDIPFFTASNTKNKYFIVNGNEVVSEKYDNIYDYSIDNGSLSSYVGTNYGDYEKKIPDKNYIHVGGKKFGPYEYVSMADYTTGRYVLTDDKGNFAFVTGKLVNKDDYIYKYRITSNLGESSEQDAIDQIKLVNGKIIYIASTLIDKENYRYKYSLYIDNKPAAEGYESIMDLNADGKTGKVTFIGCKDNSFYIVELGL